MQKELNLFVNGIKEKTGIDFAVFSCTGEHLAGRITHGEKGLCNVDGVVQDKSLDKTYFPMTFNAQKVVVRLLGSGEIEKSYSYFITELASKHKQTTESKQDFFQALLSGSLSQNKIKELCQKFGVLDAPLFVLNITFASDKSQHVYDFLQDYSQENDFYLKLTQGNCLFVKYLDQTVEDYSYSFEYAQFMYRELQEEAGVLVKIGVGGRVDGIKELALSYSQAQTTLYLMEVLKSKGNVHTYKEYVLIKMLDELPKDKLKEFLSLLWSDNAVELFSDPEMMKTAETFLENNLNASETARRMYLHRNTLNYRLDKIQNQTGLDITKFNDALTFRLITIISKILR